MSGAALWNPENPTTALQAGQNAPAPVNLLAMAGQAQQLQSNALGIQREQQSLASQNALGKIAQTAINPDGSFNTQTFAAGVKADPAATFGAMEAIKAGQGLSGGQYGLNQDSLAQTTNRTNAVGAGMAGLLSNPNLSPSDIYQSVAGQAAAGKPVGAFVQSVLPSMPTQAQGEDPGTYSGRLKTWLAGVAGQSAGPEAAIRTLTPNLTPVGLGGTTGVIDNNPYTTQTGAGSSFQNTLSAGEQIAGQTITNPDGSTYSVPTASRAVAAGYGNLVPGQSRFGTGRLLVPGGTAPSASASGGPSAGGDAGSFGAAGGSGTDPSAANSPGAAPGAAGGDGGSGGLPAGAIRTGIGPAAQAAAAAAGQGSGSDLHELYASSGNTNTQLYQLNKALTSLQGAGVTGPGTETTQAIASFLNTQTPFGLGKYLPGVDPSQIQNYDEAQKYLRQYASNAAGAMGSDSRLATALSSNASTHINGLAAQDVVKATVGIVKEQNARAQAFSASGLPDQQFDRWNSTWAASPSGDPRLYAFDLMTPQQRTTTLNSMPTAQRSGFLDQVWGLSNSGVLDPAKLGFSQAGAAAPAPVAAAAPASPPAAASPSQVPIGP